MTLMLDHDGAVTKTLNTDDLKKLRASNDKLAGVYFLHNPLTELVKIGRSEDIITRWRCLETQGGVLLHPLVFWLTTDHVRMELEFHDKYADHRVLGEWFEAKFVLPWFHTKRWEPFHELFDPLDLTPEELAEVIKDYRFRHPPDDEW